MGRGRSAVAGILSLKTGLPPVMRCDARVLILGSLPGDASLVAQEYYAHPRNQFWRLVGGIIGCNLAGINYPARLDALQMVGIALWDVIGEADRPGSLDQKIRHAQINDLREFVGRLPHLRAIAFNGKKAGALVGNMFARMSVDILHLPSSSPAYTIDAATKAEAWSVLSRYLEPLEHHARISI